MSLVPASAEFSVDPGAVVDALDDAVVVIDGDLTVHFANASYLGLFGCTEGEAVGRPLFASHAGIAGNTVLANLLKAVSTQDASVNGYVLEADFPDHGTCRIRVRAHRINHGGDPSRLTVVALSHLTDDAANTAPVTAETADALQRAEARLGDVHHRARNNLASILSMLRLEHRGITDRGTRTVLERIALRIEAVSFVYEMMRMEADRGAIHLRAYLGQMSRAVELQTGAARQKWHIEVTGEDLPVTLDDALNIGMLVTEILADAAGTDFVGGAAPGVITLVCRHTGTELVLTLSDNRVATVREAPGDQPSGLGKKLVGVYLAALQGQIEQTGTPGQGTKTTLRLNCKPVEAAGPA